jgi:hypothetical protein
VKKSERAAALRAEIQAAGGAIRGASAARARNTTALPLEHA